MKKTIPLIVIGAVIIAFNISALTAQEKKDLPSLTIEKCGSCHKIDKVCTKIGKKDEAKWKKTIERMVEKGTVLTEVEQKDMITYLSNLKDSKPICP